MKNLKLLLFFTLFTISSVQAQIVNIPDPNFKFALLNHDWVGATIDTNGDGEIQVTEAEATAALNVGGEFFSGDITDLTGIEEFVNITELYCDYNQLTSLDLSSNTALTYLNCENNLIANINITNNINLTEINCNNNLLTNLNIYNNTLLTDLYCTENQLTTINTTTNTVLRVFRCGGNQINTFDITNNINLAHFSFPFNLVTNIDFNQNTNLKSLECDSNQLTQINVTNNTLLESLVCRNNQITTLNLINNNLLYRLYCSDNLLTSIDIRNGNNDTIIHFNTENNPNLTCIFVDDITTMENIWDLNIDINSHFVETQEQCDTLATNDVLLDKLITVYPNPVTDKLLISFSQNISDNIYITISNSLGNKVYAKNLKELNKHTIDTTLFSSGIYFIKITNNTNFISKKIIIL